MTHGCKCSLPNLNCRPSLHENIYVGNTEYFGLFTYGKILLTFCVLKTFWQNTCICIFYTDTVDDCQFFKNCGNFQDCLYLICSIRQYLLSLTCKLKLIWPVGAVADVENTISSSLSLHMRHFTDQNEPRQVMSCLHMDSYSSERTP